jgi:hypothetical protein
MRTEAGALHLTREQVREPLRIPSRHFLSRGFSPEVLDALDVGDSAKLGRAVVPLYDAEGTTCIGYTFRSLKPPCKACRKHHDPWVACRYGQSRWGIMKGFPKRSYLYNYAAALRADGTAFLVEGPPDVFRLAEAGHTAVALLGSDATDEQLRLLAALEKPILVAFDNDPAGEVALGRFRRKYEASDVTFEWDPFAVPGPYQDVGETPVEELRRAILDQGG